ncbi:50S ribosomal protein L13 [Proteinivorax hydrogeniformans]|uniref:Large ribosomal subunit protein uL13 n=1 Tax=Proteinivorax hydrogeniformans TaxID=1826727 RepID=A0AAU8HU65_9FIRM
MRTTFMAKANEVERKWYIVDAEGQTLGRLASEVASILRGKHKAIYTPNVDTGDFVVIINADKAVLTGKKLEQKIYYKHSQFPGGLKKTTAGQMMDEKPERALYLAVKGMLPHNKLGSAMLKKLRVYRGQEHPHEAQMPVEWQLRGSRKGE